MKNLKNLCLFFLCLSCAVLWSCSDDDDDTLKLYSETQNADGKKVRERITDLDISLLDAKILTISGGGGNSYTAVSSDPSVIEVNVQENYLHTNKRKTGTSTITITGADKSTLVIPVKINAGTGEIEIKESASYIRSEIDTKEYQTEIDAIKKEIEEALLPVGSKFELSFSSITNDYNTRQGSFTLYPKGGNSIKGEFSHDQKTTGGENVHYYMLYTFNYNNTVHEYSIYKFEYMPESATLKDSPPITHFPWIADFTEKYTALYPHLKLTQVFGVQRVYISTYAQ